jgi:hypothetical protein
MSASLLIGPDVHTHAGQAWPLLRTSTDTYSVAK